MEYVWVILIISIIKGRTHLLPLMYENYTVVWPSKEVVITEKDMTCLHGTMYRKMIDT